MKYFEVPLAMDSPNYAGPGLSILFVFIRAQDETEARKKLSAFRMNFPYPAYHPPVEIFWPYGWFLFSVFPQKDHDVFWQQANDSGKYFNCSASLQELELAR